MNNIQNKRIPDDEFNAIREEVLKQWPTGADVDLNEAIEFHKASPKSSSTRRTRVSPSSSRARASR